MKHRLTALIHTLTEGYRRIFSIREIEESRVLQIASGATLFLFFITFFRGWAQSPALTIDAFQTNNYLCWPYFQSCGEYFFLTALPDGYSQSIFYGMLLALMFAVAYAIYLKRWDAAHAGLSLLWTWKFLAVFVLTTQLAQNFDYYDVALTFILLFLPHKLFFLRVTFVSFYFLAASVKFDAGWILGTYFTSLQTGLPIFADALATLFTNLVILAEAMLCWVLLSAKPQLRRIAFVFFLVFHLYSSIIIGYRFPVAAISMLIILFWLVDTPPRTPFDKRSIAGWIFIALVFFVQFFPVAFIRGDQKMTLEGNKYGLYMFEANHQCVGYFERYRKDGSLEKERLDSENARNRCSPYGDWFREKQRCLRETDIERIRWTFDHSIDGGPFYRIVDTENVCELEFKAFSHNEWIHLPEEGAPVVGYPVENIYY